jgi:hypothetical protein
LQWSRRPYSQHLSRCGYVQPNKTQIISLGEPILLFPLTEDEEVKGFLVHPHFQSLSMKGYSNDRLEPTPQVRQRRSEQMLVPWCPSWQQALLPEGVSAAYTMQASFQDSGFAETFYAFCKTSVLQKERMPVEAVFSSHGWPSRLPSSSVTEMRHPASTGWTHCSPFGSESIDDVGLNGGHCVVAYPADGLILDARCGYSVHGVNGPPQP